MLTATLRIGEPGQSWRVTYITAWTKKTPLVDWLWRDRLNRQLLMRTCFRVSQKAPIAGTLSRSVWACTPSIVARNPTIICKMSSRWFSYDLWSEMLPVRCWLKDVLQCTTVFRRIWLTLLSEFVPYLVLSSAKQYSFFVPLCIYYFHYAIDNRFRFWVGMSFLNYQQHSFNRFDLAY